MAWALTGSRIPRQYIWKISNFAKPSYYLVWVRLSHRQHWSWVSTLLIRNVTSKLLINRFRPPWYDGVLSMYALIGNQLFELLPRQWRPLGSCLLGGQDGSVLKLCFRKILEYVGTRKKLLKLKEILVNRNFKKTENYVFLSFHYLV